MVSCRQPGSLRSDTTAPGSPPARLCHQGATAGWTDGQLMHFPLGPTDACPYTVLGPPPPLDRAWGHGINRMGSRGALHPAAPWLCRPPKLGTAPAMRLSEASMEEGQEERFCCWLLKRCCCSHGEQPPPEPSRLQVSPHHPLPLLRPLQTTSSHGDLPGLHSRPPQGFRASLSCHLLPESLRTRATSSPPLRPCSTLWGVAAGRAGAPPTHSTHTARRSRLPSPSQRPSPGSAAAVSKRQREGWVCRLSPAMLQQRPAALAGSAAIAGGCRSRPAEGLRWQRSAGPFGGKWKKKKKTTAGHSWMLPHRAPLVPGLRG